MKSWPVARGLLEANWLKDIGKMLIASGNEKGCLSYGGGWKMKNKSKT